MLVERVFHTYAETDSSLWDIAHAFNSEGILSPSGKKWKANSVRLILRRECYVTGQAKQLRTPKGKFHSVVNGDIVPVGNGKLERGEGLTVECPTLVSSRLWEKTQEQMKRRQKSTTPGGRDGKGSVLIGLMHFRQPWRQDVCWRPRPRQETPAWPTAFIGAQPTTTTVDTNALAI